MTRSFGYTRKNPPCSAIISRKQENRSPLLPRLRVLLQAEAGDTLLSSPSSDSSYRDLCCLLRLPLQCQLLSSIPTGDPPRAAPAICLRPPLQETHRAALLPPPIPPTGILAAFDSCYRIQAISLLRLFYRNRTAAAFDLLYRKHTQAENSLLPSPILPTGSRMCPPYPRAAAAAFDPFYRDFTVP